jgi:hypothetical protein
VQGHRVAHTTETILVFWDKNIEGRPGTFPHCLQGASHRHTDAIVCPPVGERFMDYNGTTNAHQKPVSVMAELVHRFCPRTGTVADVTCGSGSTAMAAYCSRDLMDRSYYMSDREHRQVQLAETRFREGTTCEDKFRDLQLPPVAYLLDDKLVATLQVKVR